MEIFHIALILATFLCSLVAGFVFAFGFVVMPGIRKLNDREFIRAFQVMDRVIQNNQPVFLFVWVGSVVALVTSAVLGIGQLDGAGRLLIIFAALAVLTDLAEETLANAGVASNASVGDAMGLCEGIALTTERIPFGTAIANLYTRHVADYAVSAALIQELSGGRFHFGVGVSHAPVNRRLGVATGKPLSDMRTFVEGLRAVPRVVVRTSISRSSSDSWRRMMRRGARGEGSGSERPWTSTTRSGPRRLSTASRFAGDVSVSRATTTSPTPASTRERAASTSFTPASTVV